MFGIPAPTPLDLDFTLFGVPVRVSAWSWVVDLFFAWNLVRFYGPPNAAGATFAAHMAMGVLCIFFSILLHEMGHALAARWYGMEWSVLLLPLGGLAYGSLRPGVRWWQRCVISLAGPFAQLAFAAVLGGGAFAALIVTGKPLGGGPMATTMFVCLMVVNIVWPLFNLLPIFPLDGGNVLRQTANRLSRRTGDLWTGRIGLLIAVGLAALALLGRELYMTILFGFLAAQCYQLTRGGVIG